MGNTAIGKGHTEGEFVKKMNAEFSRHVLEILERLKASVFHVQLFKEGGRYSGKLNWPVETGS